MVRSLLFAISILIYGLLPGVAAAETYKLANGETLTGELLSAAANDQGVQVKIGEGQYQRIPWASFSQEDLRNFATNAKMAPFVEPFIEITREEKLKKTEVNLKPPPRLERPERQSLFGAFFSSGLGIFVMLILYAATIYAALEVALFRAQPPLLVCGLAAIPFLGVFSPIVFLVMPTRLTKRAEEEVEPAAAETAASSSAGAAASDQGDDANPMRVAGAEHPGSLHLEKTQTSTAKPKLPETVTYQRGQFTFNRRFFETKFPGFFGTVRREADRDMVLLVKSNRGDYRGERISRIAANDLHLEVHHGGVTEEVLIAFQDIQQVILKHKAAP